MLFINSGGFIIIYYQLLHSAKKEMLFSISEGTYKSEEVIKFKIPRGQYHNNKNGFLWKTSKEFQYSNRLYDIITVSKEKDSLVLICINDKAEEKILKSFHNELNGLARGDINNSRVKTSLLNLVSQALTKNSFDLLVKPFEQKLFSFSAENILLSEIEIPSPPPRLT
jgi:hypothetical protein